ncbi:unnamed protein product [Bursaphelenchus okinawaensis]|uniref:Acyl-CoA thioesterase II n=1 Tax=Bursaphelenchus okinawaensis TaxID=465554 RepID=A0A811JUZ5_9BILA|nr:unnamed protein product [Bursaphelenchus okinawaensis]CAG9085160.1 unnamed protein product [Bursaphelenchus okinawaensis]
MTLYQDVTQVNEITYTVPPLSSIREPRVYLGSLIAKAVYCAQKTVDSSFDLNSFHSYFVKNLDTSQPYRFAVEKTRNGRNFAFRSVRLIQKDKNLHNEDVYYHFEFTFKKRAVQPSLKFTQVNVPVVPQPERLRSFESILEDLPRFGFNKFQAILPVFSELLKNFEIIPCNNIEFVAGPQREVLKQHFWFKYKGTESKTNFIHQLILTYVSDIGLTYSKTSDQVNTFRLLGSLDHSGWIHDVNFTTDDYLLWEGECIMYTLGRAVTHNRIWTRSGELVASITQEAVTEGVRSLNIGPNKSSENRPKI